MLALMEVIHTDVDFRTAGHPAGELLAEEKIGMSPKLFRALNGVVIGESEEVHSPAAQNRIDFARIAITLTADTAQNGSGARAGKVRVDMHIALHVFHSKFTGLLTDEWIANTLKIQPFN
jgi:hypothetical protein